jgi:tetratricopeptide (TPR) repeat protein
MEPPAGPRPDPSKVSDLPEFVETLSRLRVWSGNPSYRVLAKKTSPLLRPPRPVSHTTVAHVFQAGRRRLDVDLVLAVVRALGVDEAETDQWRTAWFRVHVGAKAGGPAGVFRQLPADLATFTGREAALKELLSAGSAVRGDGPVTVVVSAIEGMAGVGKTQLAVRAAHELVRSGRFAEMQLYVNLRGFDPEQPPADPGTVLDGFLRALEVPAQQIPAGLDGRAAMFRDRIHDRHALLLLDNAASADQIRNLIPSSPTCFVLVTSRRALTDLDGAVRHPLGLFSRAEAVALLCRVAGPERVVTEPDVAAEIVTACGLLPLAVAMAAARLRSRPTWRLTDLAVRLSQGGVATVSAGSRSLHRVFDLSFHGLPDPARRLFCLLGIHPGADISLGAVAALVDETPGAARTMVELLHDEHLLLEKSVGRYELHDLLRSYARERAETEMSHAELTEAMGRVLGWYLQMVIAAGLAISPMDTIAASARTPTTDGTALFSGIAEAAAWCEQEVDNLTAAVETAMRLGLNDFAWRIPVAMTAIRGYAGNWHDHERLLAIGLRAAEACHDYVAQAWLLTSITGAQYHTDGDHLAAESSITRALHLHRRCADQHGEAIALAELAWLRAVSGRAGAGREIAEQAVAITGRTGDVWGRIGALNSLANCLHELEQPAQALETLLKALPAAERSGNPRSLGVIHHNIGHTYLILRRHRAAAESLARSLAFFRTSGDLHSQVDCLNGIAESLRGRGLPAEAREQADQAEALLDSLRNSGVGDGVRSGGLIGARRRAGQRGSVPHTNVPFT